MIIFVVYAIVLALVAFICAVDAHSKIDRLKKETKDDLEGTALYTLYALLEDESSDPYLRLDVAKELRRYA